ncbi:MAG: signal peptidase I [Oscillospiraceae bacterium]|nr:signal peptidase I [Oscillospiraceae bacterium]
MTKPENHKALDDKFDTPDIDALASITPGDDASKDDDSGSPMPGSEAKESKEDEKEDKADVKKKARMEVYDWIQCFVSALICGILIFVFVGRTIGVVGSSMNQTLKNSDRVLMYSLFYTPQAGDIIVFHSPNEARFNNVPLVKRVIAVGGQTIDIDFTVGDVYVDGILLSEPYINMKTTDREHFTGPLTIPEGMIFVMGDNRGRSTDSRHADVGLVDTRYVLGKVVFILIPGDNFGEPRDWGRFGVVK